MLCCLIKSVKPVGDPEHFQDAPACQNEAWVGSYTDRLASEGPIDQHSTLLAQRLVHLGSCFSDHRIDGVLDALLTHDPAHLLIDWPLGGDNHRIGSQALQFCHHLPPANNSHRPHTIVFAHSDDLPSPSADPS